MNTKNHHSCSGFANYYLQKMLQIFRRNVNGDNAEGRKWCDLPCDILASIADGLGIIDLISFRSVCKHWNSASSAATAEIESSPFQEPWFLLYGQETSQCLLINQAGNRYTINIPEMSEAVTCIASNKGWLLLLNKEDYSLHFFCPFSRAKISLPKLDNLASISNYIATFSSSPTSQDCAVSIINRNETPPETIELYVLRRGDQKEWTKHPYFNTNFVRKFKEIKCATYCGDELNIVDAQQKFLITYSFKTLQWQNYNIVTDAGPEVPTLPFAMTSHYFKQKEIGKMLGLEGNVSISICGSAFTVGDRDKVIFCESIVGSEGSGRLKGVGIHPRFFLLPPNQSW